MSEQGMGQGNGYEISSQGNRIDEYGKIIPIEVFPAYDKADSETRHRKIGSVLVDSGDEVPVVVDGEKNDEGNIIQTDEKYIVERHVDEHGNVYPRVFESDPHLATVKQEAIINDIQTRPEQARLSYWREQLNQAEQDGTNSEAEKARAEVEAWERKLDERTGATAELFYELRKVAPERIDTMPVAEYMRMTKEYTDLLRKLDTSEKLRKNDDLDQYLAGANEYIRNPEATWSFRGNEFTYNLMRKAMLNSIYERAAENGKIEKSSLSRYDRQFWDFIHQNIEKLLADHPKVRTAFEANERDHTGLQIAELHKEAIEELAAYRNNQVEAATKAVEAFKDKLKGDIAGDSDQSTEATE